MSRRNRSLSSLSFDLMSHSRQESGLISSATTMRIFSPSQRRPHSILKSTRRMPTPRNRPDRKSLTRIAKGHDVVDLLRRRPAERGDVLFGDHRIVQRVVLVVEFDDRAGQLRALLDAEPRRQRAGGDIPDHDLQRNDLHLADQLLAHIEPADEMGRNADIVEILKEILRNSVIQNAFPIDDLMLLRVKGGGVVLEMLDQRSRLGALIEDLGLAFINAATAVHGDQPWLEEIHGSALFAGLRRALLEATGEIW